MGSRIFLLMVFTLGVLACNTSPYSKLETHTPEEDNLTSSSKIAIYEESATVSSATSYAALARLYENQQAWSRAMGQIKMAIKEDPMNSYYHSLKANYAYALNDVSTAYREALTAYQLGSQSLQQSLILAKMAVALSEFSIVNNIIDSLAIVYPNDPEVLYMAARKYDKTGNNSLAESYYGKVLKLDSSYQDNILYYADFLFRQKQYNKAKEVLGKIEKREPSINILRLKADLYYNLGELDSAVALYKETVRLNADTITYNRIIDIYIDQGSTDELIQVYREASDDFPEIVKYKLLAARALDKRYRYDDALVYYEEAFEMDTTDTLIAAELSYLQRKMAYLQRKKNAERMLSDSLKNQLTDSVKNE
jgi:tetratricopeptide (TPR) repeat protein